ncbi:large subunit ribosomal protein L4 [Herbihabitans rhizosphaerae]|uniref:Large ribosomal subunit protein uL4 n=1 Tax=Herbihabitans rhizosphaerae TaxID=1872711 RepID=A0A4Q7KLQ0_9PSEU|nr:large subunit ribosomal protein L4 [Herbihabitans rhizosphaerae]
MSKIDIKTPAGKTDGSVELPAEIFDAQANIALMHQVVVAQLAAAREGNHSTKTRGEVRGGGKKPYRQKGTGRARQGSVRAPQFAGGGIVHGPQPRDYTQRTPKKMKAAALRGALSDRVRAGQLHVITGLVDGDKPSTKGARKVLESVTEAKRLLVVLTRDEDVNWVSVRNLPHVHVIAPDQLNTYDVLVNDDVVFTKTALDAFLAGPVKGGKAKAKATSTEVPAAPGAEAPYQGSHAPLADPSEVPDGFPIKGNEGSKLYHLPGSSFYKRTVAEVWFATAEDAEKAGFQLPPSQRKEEDK